MELSARRFADTLIVSPVGSIDHTTSDDLKQALAPHLERCAGGQDRVVLDLSGVEYVSSAGLRVLMLASRQAKAQGGTLALAALQPLVREVFEISRFNLVFQMFPSVRDAVAAVSASALASFEAD